MLSNIQTETAYVIELMNRKVRYLGRDIGRNYGILGEYELGLSIDLQAKMDDVWCVTDWKTGQKHTEAQKNLQIMAAAYAVAKHQKVTEIIGRLGYIDERGRIEYDAYEFNASDLYEAREAIVAVFRNVYECIEFVKAGGTPTVYPSESSCRYCSAFSSCPKNTALAKNLVPELDKVRDAILSLSPEQAGFAWDKWKQAERICDEIGKALKAIAARQYEMEDPLRTPDGRVISLSKRSKTSTDGEKALRLAEKYGASPGELADCIRVTKYDAYIAKKVKDV